jgi:chaperonin GroES
LINQRLTVCSTSTDKTGLSPGSAVNKHFTSVKKTKTKKMKELQPLNQNVLLDMTQPSGEQRTAGGIIIPDTAKEKPQVAKVIATGNIENSEISAGDMVLFRKFSGTDIEFEGKKYLIVPYSDLLAKIVETETI